METVLRIICDTPRSAAFNMAADLYLLSRCAEEPSVFVRFYFWADPTVTLGYAQKPEDCLNEEACTNNGITWIRRPTGGRAVFHCQDITYSCVFAKKRVGMGGDIAQTYHLISRCLITGLQLSHINGSSHTFAIEMDELKHEVKLPCFLAPNRSEIMVQGKKLVGSAQKRATDAVLQHGSLPVTGRFRDLPLYQNVSSEQQEVFLKLLQQKCTCIEECLPACDVEKIVENLQKGFVEVLPFTAEMRGWEKEEEEEIEALAGSEDFKNSWMR